MKLNMNTIALGFAAFAAYFVLKPAKAGATGGGSSAFDMLTKQRKEVGAATGANTAKVVEVFAQGGQDFQGWRYFTDGTSIGPDGAYYSGNDFIFK